MTNLRRRSEEDWIEEAAEEEEEERFYESLDRIVSCSSSSCSSDNDDGPPHHHQRHYRGGGGGGRKRGSDAASALRFSMAALSMYDVWVAEPASVQERRQRLLRHLGLASDRTLARMNSSVAPFPVPSGVGEDGDVRPDGCPGRRSASCNQLAADPPRNSVEVAIARSSSDGAFSTVGTVVHSNHLFDVDDHHQGSGRGGSNGPSPAPSKPPIGKLSRRSGELAKFAANSESPFAAVSADFGHHLRFEDDSDSVVSGENDQAICTIKNLDNGEEFVVNEFGEDGTWNKLRQVGTDRQLTGEEFQMCVVGHSPIVQELMRRQNVEEGGGKRDSTSDSAADGGTSRVVPKVKNRGGGWLRSIKNVASSVAGHHHWERRSSDERDTSSEKGGRRSSSATDDSQDISTHTPERTKVRHYGKSCKELTALYMSQEIQGHNGCIWSIKFSLDGRFLASAGEDRVIHVWQVIESERRGDLLPEKLDEGVLNPFLMGTGSPEVTLALSNGETAHMEKKRRRKISYGRKSMTLDHVAVPENVFALSEKPICSFQGHLADVLDLSWSKSEYLLSSSMDKTVRLWHMSSKSCLKIFSHSDFVTCIQFNPVDDRYFISGSLDSKVRIWSIPDRQVVDWNDLHEMVTAACYTPDGQGALVGSHKGSCHLYDTSDNKLHQKCQIDLQRRKKKSHIKKITGFQYAPDSSSEVLITSADSRVWVVDDVDLVHKFKGFRNTSSQISASLTTNGKYVVCASEDSHVYIWRYDDDARPIRGKAVTITRAYEHFHCQDVSVAVPWPGITQSEEASCTNGEQSENFAGNHQNSAISSNMHEGSHRLRYNSDVSPLHRADAPSSNGSCYFCERGSVTWPEDKLLTNNSDRNISSRNENFGSGNSAWGMVIVTAGLGGEIRTYQNFGLPIQI